VPALLLWRDLERQFLFLGAGHHAPHGLHIVGIDAGVEAGPGERNVGLSLIDQAGMPAAMDVRDNAVDRAALGGVAGAGVAEVDLAASSSRMESARPFLSSLTSMLCWSSLVMVAYSPLAMHRRLSGSRY